jgi:hypothetical protein
MQEPLSSAIQGGNACNSGLSDERPAGIGCLEFKKVRVSVQDFLESTALGGDESAYEFLALGERKFYAQRPRFVAPIEHENLSLWFAAARCFTNKQLKLLRNC